MVRRIIFLASMTALVLALTAGSALGYTDYVKYMSKQTTSTQSTSDMYALGCMWCHGWDKQAAPNTTNQVNVMSVRTSLLGVTNPTGNGEVWTNIYQQYGQPYGPHGGYSNTTDRCKVCHDVHAANGDKRLLPQATVAQICETCHDFTEGISIYGQIKANTGNAPAGVHRIYGLASSEGSTDTASGSLIPGGQLGVADPYFPLTGGTTTYAAAALASGESNLTCTDCHTPHGNTSMRPYKGDRVRLGTSILVAACNVQPANIVETQFPVTLPNVGLVPAGTPIAAPLQISPNSPVYGLPADGKTATEITPAGTALAVSLIGAGVLDVHIETTTTAATTSPYGFALVNAWLSRVASNKLLRDNINGVDLRTAAFGGNAPTSNDVTYDQTLTQWDPVLGANAAAWDTAEEAPWNNGQNDARAEYGSGFCYSCHQGRLGNIAAGLVINPLLPSAGTLVNHPTLMDQPYRTVGGLMSGGFGDLNQGGYPAAMTVTGLAVSNAGFTMEPVQANPDGRIVRQNAPICQQCHEDSRDVESAFAYYDTDKSVPFDYPINTALGFDSGDASFIQDSIGSANPAFGNFPHETTNLRLLVEGGDSSAIEGGNNDDLCLNCHVPGSTFRIGYGDVPGAKDLGGYME